MMRMSLPSSNPEQAQSALLPLAGLAVQVQTGFARPGNGHGNPVHDGFQKSRRRPKAPPWKTGENLAKISLNRSARKL
eukprot:7980294-Alexandrium_andersonii.AAC.1